ncbi:NACHT domain-containing protein [Favolaschia claudopus]|uniref:NACHT domain-containing protein n=1 Tax=Favolaschia claudopus TaxID=2862362 RepID=A0AAW0A978_9AGAR
MYVVYNLVIERFLMQSQLEITMSIENKIDKSNVQEIALRILYNASAPDATHDTSESFTHPPCHPNTRLTILDDLTTWSQDTSDSAPQIVWMHGPAGTEKSAIAQSLCEALQDQTSLGGSFFFKRGHLSRGNAARLWPTIAYQLARSSPSFKAAIATRLTSDPALVNKSLPTQLQQLLIDPYHDAAASIDRNLVVIIDGLDECEDEARQQEILRSLPRFLPCRPRLRILIVSRPETHIKQVFGEPALSSCVHLTVPGASKDVLIYLTDEFKRIRETHAAMASISCPWPEENIILYIMRKSSGHFIYAATVIRFVEDNDFDPAERLVMITLPQSQEPDPKYVSPISALDELYLQILGAVPYRPQLSRVFSVIAGIFLATEIILMIQRLHSLIEIKERSQGRAVAQYLSVYHASFLDFLSDPSRSRNFHFSDKDRQNLATDMLEALSQNSTHRDEAMA